MVLSSWLKATARVHPVHMMNMTFDLLTPKLPFIHVHLCSIMYRWLKFGENVSNTLQDIVSGCIHRHTHAQTNRTKPLCLRTHYVGRRHKKAKKRHPKLLHDYVCHYIQITLNVLYILSWKFSDLKIFFSVNCSTVPANATLPQDINLLKDAGPVDAVADVVDQFQKADAERLQRSIFDQRRIVKVEIDKDCLCQRVPLQPRCLWCRHTHRHTHTHQF